MITFSSVSLAEKLNMNKISFIGIMGRNLKDLTLEAKTLKKIEAVLSQ